MIGATIKVIDKAIKKAGPYVVTGAKAYYKEKIRELVRDEYAKSQNKKREDVTPEEGEKVNQFMRENEQLDKLGEKYQRTLFSNINYDSIFEPDVQSLRSELRGLMRKDKVLS